MTPNEYLQMIENEENPDDYLLNMLQDEQSIEKENVGKCWKMLVDAYKTELELIYKN